MSTTETALPAEHTESPEVSGRYECPKCGNKTHFEGIDELCGASQKFTVDDEGEPDYDCYEGFDINGYNAIQCRQCEATIWEDDVSRANLRRLVAAAHRLLAFEHILGGAEGAWGELRAALGVEE